MQKTLQREVSASGKGLFTGEKVRLKICPAAPNTGVVFQRIDLPGKPLIPAILSSVDPSPRCTRLSSNSASVYMVEHLLAAMSALEVDNALIQVEGPEIASGDGSSQIFVDLIEEAGLVTQSEKRSYLEITEPLYFSEKEIHLIALPAPEFRLSYTLHYPQSSVLGTQYYAFSSSPAQFKKEIAPCRTFSLYEEIFPLLEKGIIKGGGLENALVIKGDQIMNPGGARFPDEMVRHKILDLIGDLALVGAPILGHIIAIRSGHSSNVAFAKTLCKPAILEPC
jgi:UDP-3-O-[3-hydroxymyristoyl] N-acetylglucosamine deacetylase